MSSAPLSDAKIIDSWKKNAAPWTTAVREGQIESRRLCTDRAIVDAVISGSPRSAIDVGCGEGWLCRQLAERGVEVLGIDVVQELIAQAQQAGGASYQVGSYEDVDRWKIDSRVDVVVCNFSLLGKESVDGLFAAVPKLLNPQGKLIVQTLHPQAVSGECNYEDGWRAGSWDGFSDDFSDPAPWYFRTRESWDQLFEANGFSIREFREPTLPDRVEPVSLILLGELVGNRS